MSTRLRQRKSWEAIDLGFCLGQRWFLQLWLLWMLPATVTLALTLAVFESNLLALLITWWLQPLYERPLLHFLSRALFGEFPPLKKEISNYWRIALPQILPQISWRRFNPTRSFVEPVTLLEGLRGSARRRRINILGIGLNGTAAWFSLLCWCFDLVLIASQIFLLQLVIPDEWAISIFDMLNDPYQSMHWLGAVTWLIAASITAPFYIAGGFTLYISRRTQLEGWDIELEFRKISSRLQQAQKKSILPTVILTLIVPLLILPPEQAKADSERPAIESLVIEGSVIESTPYKSTANKKDARALIEKISAQAEFGEEKTRTVWRKIAENDNSKNDAAGNRFIETLKKFVSLFSWMADIVPALAMFLKVIFILAVIGFVIWLLRRYTGWLNWLGVTTTRKKRKKTAPTSLFGLELSRESLPDDIAKTALALLDRGNIRATLSLLFRASLSHLVHHSELPIADSTTEGECLRLVENCRPQPEIKYFRSLTRAWLLLAYAHQPPPAEVVRNLCRQWPQFYHSPDLAEGEV